MSSTPFAYAEHLLTVPVVVNGHSTRFILDTGIGLTLVSTALAHELRCEPTGGTYTGRRMSGQEVTLELARLDALSFGNVTAAYVEVGLFDMTGFPPELDGVEGFLSLAFLAETPFTVDYGAGEVVLESAETLAMRQARGTTVPVRVDVDGPAVCVFLPLTTPDGTSLAVEVDTGTDVLVLDESLAPRLGIDLSDGAVRRAAGEDETGYSYARSFARLRGAIHVTDAPELSQAEPEVMFQRIIHDGLVGDAFLRRFAVTYDLRRAEMILASQASW